MAELLQTAKKQMSTEEIAAALDETERTETIFHIACHLAPNHRFGITTERLIRLQNFMPILI